MARSAKAEALITQREGALAAHVRQRGGAFDPHTLSKSYGVSPARALEIVTRNGGTING